MWFLVLITQEYKKICVFVKIRPPSLLQTGPILPFATGFGPGTFCI